MAHSVNHPPEPGGLVGQALASPGGRQRIFGQIFKSVQNRQLADDLCQEVCTKLLQHQSKFDPSLGTVWAWISGFVRHELTNHYSKQKHQREQLGTAMDEVASRPSSLPIDHLEHAELLELLKTNLNKLSERSRAVLWHHYIQGDSDTEAARQLGITPENLRQIRRRALLELRQYLGASVEVAS